MKRFLLGTTGNNKSVSSTVLALAFAFSAFVTSASAQELTRETPNLARPNNGAEIECTTPDGRIELVRPEARSAGSGLVLNDESLSCPLQQGRTTFVIKLPSTFLLDRFTFVNENASAAGELKISVSNYQLPATSSKWVEVDGSVTFSRKRLFNLSMVGVEARYVKLSFNVESGGRIAGLGLYGGRTLDHSVWKNLGHEQMAWVSGKNNSRHRNNARDYDYAKLNEKARVVYVSSGTMLPAQQMIDRNNKTAFRFAANDPHPTAIVELATTEEIHRVSVTYKLHTPGRLDVYLLDDMSKSSTDLNYRTPNASAVDETGEGEAAVDFDPEGARYVAVRFTPIESMTNDRPFEIVEIDAFGTTPEHANTMEAPDLYPVDYTTAPFPSQSGTEISSSKLGTLAIPPILPEVSP